ncbi:MAG: AAA family ATPase, partial [Chloroflexota bacterium]
MIALRNLTPGESRLYLARRGVPAAKHERVLAFTHGHPLALSLVADLFTQRTDLDFRPEAAPDLVGKLLERFLLEAPGPLHRLAIEA